MRVCRIIYTYLFGCAGQRLWLLYGFAIWLHKKKLPVFARIVNLKVERDYGCYLSVTADLHPSVKFPHPVGIVIGAGARVGEGAVIYQGVTIGGRVLGDWEKGNYPKVGSKVTIFANATLLGSITIGDNAIIGANSVVNRDVMASTTVVGAPAKVIGLVNDREL